MDQIERTTLLRTLAEESGGDAREQLWPDIYDELRRLAQHYMGRAHHPQVTIQPTAIVHEAFVRLVDHQSLNEHSKTHFFAVAANAMRYVLADYARKRHAEKRGGNADRVTMHSGISEEDASPLDALALHDALSALEAKDGRTYQVVELRFFAGLSIEQTAQLLNVSPGTVKNEWRWARAWLKDQLSSTDDASSSVNSDAPSNDVDTPDG